MWSWFGELSGPALFVGGNVSGAVIGVIVDRLWRRFEQKLENRVNLRVIGSVYTQIGNVEGFHFTVTNLAAVPLPDYDIVLFHPLRGSLSMFRTERTGPLIPEQDRTHEVAIMRNGSAATYAMQWFSREGHQKVENPTGAGVVFRLVMKDSKKILYENAKMGEALANAVLRGEAQRSLLHMTFEESMALQDLDEKYVLEQKRWVDRIKAESEKSKASPAA